MKLLTAVSVLALSAGACFAQVLPAHPGPTNNGLTSGTPAMFLDLEAIASPLVVTHLKTSSNAAAGATFPIEVLTRTGTALGGPVGSGPGSSMTGWTSLGTVIATQGAVASGVSLDIDIPDIVIGPGQVIGVALRYTTGAGGAGPRYFGTTTVPPTLYQDANLKLTTGDVRSAPFTTTGSYFQSRQLVGDVTYSLGGSVGACCLTSGANNCTTTTPTGCTNLGGTYQGDGSVCATANCPPLPTGACCAEDGTCTVVSQFACAGSGGVYQGNNSACTGQCVATAYLEASGPEAGETLANAALTLGNSANPLTKIRGSFLASDMDMYAINICNEAAFSASTVGGTTADTQMFLFDASGRGLVMGDDDVAPLPASSQTTLSSQFVTANGLHFLAVGVYNRDPADGTSSTTQLIWNNTNPGAAFGPEWAPNGPGAANPVANWTGTIATTGNYAITLNGTCFLSATMGACCLGAPGYSCIFTTQAGCTGAGGTYAGDNITCAAANCPPAPTGACCKADGTCETLTSFACLNIANATYAGNGVDCVAANCPQPGACCLPNFVCTVMQQSACTTAGGTFQGPSSACGSCPTPPVGSVAIYAADSAAAINDAQAKLVATGLFPAVVARNITSPAATPTLADLQQFKAVLVWSNQSFTSGAALGDVMADYIDAGGGVVNCVFSISTTTANRFLAGRWDSTYQILVQGGGNTSAGGERSIGTVHVPGHPILLGVNTFSGGTSSFRPTGTTLTGHGQLIAQWSDTVPANGKMLISTSSTRARRVDLGMVPYSTTAVTTGWNATTDGGRLMANALLYAGRNLCYADCDGAGGLTANDFQCFLDAAAAGSPYANCDGTGGITANDFQCFLNAFAAGCP